MVKVIAPPLKEIDLEQGQHDICQCGGHFQGGQDPLILPANMAKTSSSAEMTSYTSRLQSFEQFATGFPNLEQTPGELANNFFK